MFGFDENLTEREKKKRYERRVMFLRRTADTLNIPLKEFKRNFRYAISTM